MALVYRARYRPGGCEERAQGRVWRQQCLSWCPVQATVCSHLLSSVHEVAAAFLVLAEGLRP